MLLHGSFRTCSSLMAHQRNELISMHQRNGSSDVSALPLPCPQDGTSSYSEDCLSMVLYVPVTLKATDGVPVFMWLVPSFRPCLSQILIIGARVHGGSFIKGSANADGLDGSALALATNSIVAVIQYRLGAVSNLACCFSRTKTLAHHMYLI